MFATRAAHRNRVTRAQAIANGDQPPRPPGRPMKHGFYAKGERIAVDELVELYNSLMKPPKSPNYAACGVGTGCQVAAYSAQRM